MEEKTKKVIEVQDEAKLDDEKIWCVYMHISPSGKRYIGITSQTPERRWRDGNGYKDSPYFWKAINKYGWNAFEHTIIKTNLSVFEACDLERALIKKYNTLNRDFGYNLTSGGDSTGGTFMSEESRKKLSESQKNRFADPQNHPFYGKYHSEETKDKISKANTGRLKGTHLSEETKLKISQTNKGHQVSEESREKMRLSKLGKYSGENNPMYGVSPKERMDEEVYQGWLAKISEKSSGENNPMYGKHHSEETKEKIRVRLSESMVGDKNPFYGKHHTEQTKEKIRQYNIENAPIKNPIYSVEFNQYYKTAAEAERQTGISAHGILGCCHGYNGQKSAGKHPITGEKLHWNFVSVEEYFKYANKGD